MKKLIDKNGIFTYIIEEMRVFSKRLWAKKLMRLVEYSCVGHSIADLLSILRHSDTLKILEKMKVIQAN